MSAARAALAALAGEMTEAAVAHCTPEGFCRDCGETEAGICPDCAGSLRKAQEFRIAGKVIAAVITAAGTTAAGEALAEERRDERMRVFLRQRKDLAS